MDRDDIQLEEIDRQSDIETAIENKRELERVKRVRERVRERE